MIRLETDRLILRDYTNSDIDEYYHLKNDDKTMYYLQDIKLHSIEEAKEDLDSVIKDQESKNRELYFLHMEHKETKEQIGSIGYHVTSWTPVGKLVHLGYFTYPKFWNYGYMTEAVRKVMQYAFEENDVYRFTTGCLKENVGSERVMLKCGMKKEAEHIDFEWHDGMMKTRLEYRMLKNEYFRLLHSSI